MLHFRNFTNTNLKWHLEKHTNEYQEFIQLNREVFVTKTKVTNSSQRILEETIAISKPFEFDHPRSRKIHRAIGEMIALDCMPFSTVERPGFQRLMKEVEPRYTPCSRNYLSQSLIASIFDKVKEQIATLLKAEQHISLTTDIWSSDSLDSYLSFTAHWINTDWECKECCLHAQPFNERHTGENIVATFTTCMDEWKISQKLHLVLLDSASNFVAGFRNSGILSSSCFAHSLQLAIKDGILVQRSVEVMLSTCRKLVGHFKHSNVSLHALAAVQSKPQHKPVQNEPTRWNSSYYM